MLVSLFVFNVALAQVEEKSDFSSAESKVMKMEALRLWQKRDDQQSLEESLSKFEHVHAANPQDLDTLIYLIRGYFTLAELHLDNKDLKMRNFEKAKSFGEKALELNPDYKKIKDDDLQGAIAKLSKKEVPPMFWMAAALGKWAKLNGVMASLKYKSQILAMIRQVEKLWPDFFHGAVPRYWGGFYAVAPRIAGGDMKKSKENFKKAMLVAPEYLGTKVLYAELYLTEEDDKKEFKKQLEEVLAASDGPAELQPENRLEKKKAEKLLEQIDKLF